MKKILVVLIILITAKYVNAQRVTASPNNFNYKEHVTEPDSIIWPKLGEVPNIGKRKIIIQPLVKSDLLANMPVAIPQGNSNMPVVQTDVTGYTMPVAGKRLPRLYYMQKPNPGPGVVIPAK